MREYYWLMAIVTDRGSLMAHNRSGPIPPLMRLSERGGEGLDL
jgi:hypothetical protein